MSKRIASVTLSLLAALAALAVTPTAEAQCRPGSWLCAQVQVGVSGSVYVGPTPPPPPPPQVVYVQPQPQPPVVIYQPPPPPPPPQVVYVQQQPQQVYVQQQPVVGIQPMPPVQLREPRWGVHGEIGAMTTDRIAMGGGSVAFRLRPSPWFGVDLGIGTYGGVDYDGNERFEVPLTANALFFVNPQHRLQLYFLAGVGLSYAHVDNFGFSPSGGFSGDIFGRDFAYVGGQLGIGLEWRLGRHFALNTDLRGFIRTRTDGGDAPEFTDPDTGATTNTSGGVYWTGGATIYW